MCGLTQFGELLECQTASVSRFTCLDSVVPVPKNSDRKFETHISQIPASNASGSRFSTVR